MCVAGVMWWSMLSLCVLRCVPGVADAEMYLTPSTVAQYLHLSEGSPTLSQWCFVGVCQRRDLMEEK